MLSFLDISFLNCVQFQVHHELISTKEEILVLEVSLKLCEGCLTVRDFPYRHRFWSNCRFVAFLQINYLSQLRGLSQTYHPLSKSMKCPVSSHHLPLHISLGNPFAKGQKEEQMSLMLL